MECSWPVAISVSSVDCRVRESGIDDESSGDLGSGLYFGGERDLMTKAKLTFISKG